jgi:hypothetical protein
MITTCHQTILASFGFALVAALGCRASSPLGTDPAPSMEVTTQPSALVQDGGTFTCAATTSDIYAGCPATIQGAADGQPCSLPKDTVCDYQSDGAFGSCSCMPTALGTVWVCGSVGGGYDCPASRPAEGSSCGASDYGRSCIYGRPLACTCEADRNSPYRRAIQCSCKQDAGAWQCSNWSPAENGSPEASFVESPCYGSGIALPRPPLDEGTIIKDLTDDEVATWCDWFVSTNRGDGPPPPSQPPEITSDGYPNGYGFTSCTIGGAHECVSFVPATYCQKLLRYGSCDQPLRALDDCYLTLRNECEDVGDACEGMGLDPSCRQTVVQLGTWHAQSCPHLPVKW